MAAGGSVRSVQAFWIGGAASTVPPSTSGGYRSFQAFWMGGACSTAATPPTPPVVPPTTGDPGGHREEIRRLLALRRNLARQDEIDADIARQEQRSRDEQQRSVLEPTARPEPPTEPPPTEPKAELTATSPLPMVANFGTGPITIGVKLPSFGEAIRNADDEDAIIAIILAAQ